MDILYLCCAGLDVHKKTEIACRTFKHATGEDVVEVRTFATLTSDLLLLSDWLRAGGITHVAIQSTGVYNVLGRKTDVNAAQWLAELYRWVSCKPLSFPRLLSGNCGSWCATSTLSFASAQRCSTASRSC